MLIILINTIRGLLQFYNDLDASSDWSMFFFERARLLKCHSRIQQQHDDKARRGCTQSTHTPTQKI